eukprot:2510087-Amphidinium_carterae.1
MSYIPQSSQQHAADGAACARQCEQNRTNENQQVDFFPPRPSTELAKGTFFACEYSKRGNY